MNREILRLRADINSVIHLHHDEMIAFMAAGYDKIRSFSLTYGYLMQKPAYYLPASINVEEDVGPIKTFIQDTNCIIMKRHGFTVLGRTVSEAYHRTCVLVSEIKRNIIVEMLCAANGKTPEEVTDEEMAYMASHGVTRFFEIGAGRVLSGLVKRIAEGAVGISVGGPNDIAAAKDALAAAQSA